MRPQRVTPRDLRLARLAAMQHGVVARAQLVDLGMDASAIARSVRAGRLHRIHRAVYAVGHPVIPVEGRYLAAVLASGPGAVLSHRSAAALWGLRPDAGGRIDVTVPAAGGRRPPAPIRLHRTRRQVESALVRAVPVTTVARTLADLAEVVPRRALEKAAEQAEALRLLDMTEVRAVAAGRPGRAGPAAVVRLLAGHDVAATTRSPLEDAFLALCDRYGISRPAINSRVEGFELDFAWPDRRLIVETDGHRHHGTRAAFERDRRRDAELMAAGWRVLRLTDRRVRGEPAEVAWLLQRILGRDGLRPARR